MGSEVNPITRTAPEFRYLWYLWNTRILKKPPAFGERLLQLPALPANHLRNTFR
ncbi:hypothetical protein KKC1_31710 [Calderihabitans maritimus]|uniref:Uncharacterized protein n=1 Tax=Calderihabitans maritimus TaxID=1246530 RepID=A0A1Z5HWZ5_9FIRM|nr:hypothetical protein KKC1_31710 [Calderihabitans maritimus]